MAECDPDGKIAQWFGDMAACLVMDVNESVADAAAKARAALDEAAARDELSTETRRARLRKWAAGYFV